MTYDGANAQLWIDGDLASSQAAGFPSNKDATVWKFGLDTGGGNEYFLDGQMADLQIYNRVLSNDERLSVGRGFQPKPMRVSKVITSPPA